LRLGWSQTLRQQPGLDLTALPAGVAHALNESAIFNLLLARHGLEMDILPMHLIERGQPSYHVNVADLDILDVLNQPLLFHQRSRRSWKLAVQAAGVDGT